MTTTPPAVAVVCRVRRLLDGIGDALADGRVDPLLASEAELGPALAALTAVRGESLPDELRRELRDEIARCALALSRCRRLGAALERMTADALASSGHAGSYTRAGDADLVAPAGVLQARG